MLELPLDESVVPTCGDRDPAGILSIKKWIKLKHPGAKEVTWENLLWLLNECKADADDPKADCEMIKNLKAWITSAPRDDSEPEKMDTDCDSEFTVMYMYVCAYYTINSAIP